jgi:hypothetical protein
MASTSAAARESTKEPGLSAPSRSHGRHRGRSAKNPVTIHASTTAAPPPSSSSSHQAAQDAERLKLAASFARNSRDSEEYAERLRSLGKELKTTEASAAGPVATQPPSMITPGRKVHVAKLQSGMKNNNHSTLMAQRFRCGNGGEYSCRRQSNAVGKRYHQRLRVPRPCGHRGATDRLFG